MAVYTQVSDEALRAFLTSYDLGEVLAFKGIAEGVENSNYLLRTDRGHFILTLYEKRVAEADLPFFIGLMDHLAQASFPCPKPVRNRNGDALGHLEGRSAAIVSFLSGMGVVHPSDEHCRQAGETLAKLHLTARDLTLTRRNALGPHGWQPLAAPNIDRADEVEIGLGSIVASELKDLTENWPTNLPHGVIHGDFFRDNVFFLGGKLSGVIDFYFACNDLLAYDLAIAVNAWCFRDDLTFNEELANSLVAGYQSVRALKPEEVAAFGQLCRGSALRFLLTRLNDWLNVPEGALVIPHDPKAFSARLRFHSLQTDLGVYGLG